VALFISSKRKHETPMTVINKKGGKGNDLPALAQPLFTTAVKQHAAHSYIESGTETQSYRNDNKLRTHRVQRKKHPQPVHVDRKIQQQRHTTLVNTAYPRKQRKKKRDL
jgi:hypothetical protein